MRTAEQSRASKRANKCTSKEVNGQLSGLELTSRFLVILNLIALMLRQSKCAQKEGIEKRKSRPDFEEDWRKGEMTGLERNPGRRVIRRSNPGHYGSGHPCAETSNHSISH